MRVSDQSGFEQSEEVRDYEKELADNIRSQGNLVLGMVGGTAAGLVGAAIWAAITVLSGWQIGLLAIAVGAMVGFGVRIMGKGFTETFGVAGGIIAGFSLVVGNLLSVIAYVAKIDGISIFRALAEFDNSLSFEIIVQTSSPMDFVFYAIGIYEGWKLAIAR